MTQEIIIENLKCGGCANTIKKGVLSIDDVESVEVNLETSQVKYTTSEDVLNEVKEKLSKIGYPVAGEKNTVVHKAQSFVSCAVGRIDNHQN